MMIIIISSKGRIFIGFKSNSFAEAFSFFWGLKRTDWPLNLQGRVIKLEPPKKTEPIK